MLFVILAICVGGFFAVWWSLSHHHDQNVAKQLEQNAYNQKVKKLKVAKELLRSKQNLMSLHNKLVMMYSNEPEYQKKDRSKVVVQIMKLTDDLELATAVCALARIEAKRRQEKKHVQSP